MDGPNANDDGSADENETVSSLRERVKELESTVQAKDKQLALYEEQLRKVAVLVGKGGVGPAGSSVKEIKASAGPGMEPAITVIVCFINGTVWKRTKLLPDRWEEWNSEPKSVCQMTIGRIVNSLPRDWSKFVVWHLFVVPTINSVLIDRRNNSVAAMKIIFKGELNLITIMYTFDINSCHVFMNKNYRGECLLWGRVGCLI